MAEAREKKKMGKSFINAIKKELRDAEKELKKYDTEMVLESFEASCIGWPTSRLLQRCKGTAFFGLLQIFASDLGRF